jgi:hypothetical protein
MASINIVCMVLRVCSIVPKRKSAVQHSPTSLEVKFLEWLRIYILGTSGKYIYFIYLVPAVYIYLVRYIDLLDVMSASRRAGPRCDGPFRLIGQRTDRTSVGLVLPTPQPNRFPRSSLLLW